MDDRPVDTAVHAVGLGLIIWIALAWTFDATDWSQQTHLTVAGAVLELIGIALVAMDFWRPWLSRAGRAARDRLKATMSRTRLRVDSLRGRHFVTLVDQGLTSPAMDEIIAKRSGYPPVRTALIELDARVTTLEARQTSEYAAVSCERAASVCG
jgi:hypothetical protein